MHPAGGFDSMKRGPGGGLARRISVVNRWVRIVRRLRHTAATATSVRLGGRRRCKLPAAPAFRGLEPLEPRLLLNGQPGVSSLDVLLDYRFDTNNFFDTQEKRDVLQLAADTAVGRLLDDLRAINPSSRNRWTATFTHPGTGEFAAVQNMRVGADELVVFAGGRNLDGPAIGQGGPGGFSASGSGSFVNTVATRGEQGAGRNRPTDFGPWGGVIAFETNANWHFGLTGAGLSSPKKDFFSVALHEMVHVLGFGTAGSWEQLVDAENARFTGAASTAEYDKEGNPPLARGSQENPDLSHWKNTVRDEGKAVAMDPTTRVGKRTQLTELDLAALDDIGWEVRTGGQIHGVKWADADQDAKRDAGESGVEGWTIFLDDNENGLLDDGERSTTTDADGEYWFTELSPGGYTVAELPRAGWIATAGGPHDVQLDPVEVVTGIDFGNFQLPLMADLTVSVMTLDLPDTLVPGDRGKAELLVRNIDTLGVNQTVNVKLVASINDQIGDGDDVMLGGLNRRLRLPAGQIGDGEGSKLRLRLQVPGAAAAGSYQVFAVVDADNAVPERNELDNVDQVEAPRFDLALVFGQVDDRIVKRVTVDGITYQLRGAGSGAVVRGAGRPSVIVDGSDDKSMLQLRAGRDVPAVVHDVTVNGSARKIDLRKFTVTGDIFAAGTLEQLFAGTIADQHTITVDGTAERKTFSIRADVMRDVTVNSQLPVSRVDVGVWENTDDIADIITAPWAGVIRSKRNFEAGLNLTDASVAQSLNQLSVRQDIIGAVIRTAAGIRTIRAARLIDTTIFAGLGAAVADDALPAAAGDFAQQAAIATVSVRSRNTDASWLSNVRIAAFSLGKVSGGFAAATGQIYGLAAANYNSLSYRNGQGTVRLRSTDATLSTPGDTAVDADLIVRVVAI